MAPNGWHVGERLIHKKLGHETDYSIMMLYADIQGDLPPEHALFHSTRLPFLPVTTLDASGRPWGSILAGKEGQLGFIRNSRYNVLLIDAELWPGEPIIENAKLYNENDGSSMLIAGIGIEFSTRRRNKLAGRVTRLDMKGYTLSLDLSVDQALGNCPKYINVRNLVPYPNRQPSLVYNKPQLDSNERLPDELITFIIESDTVFFGTTYSASKEDAQRYPSHLGMNQRGGRPGFIRVLPSDGRTVVLPDYSGNRFLTSLGNIESTPLASLTFVSFTTGTILYLTGHAQNLHDRAAQKVMPLQNALTMVYVTGYTYVSDALPVRHLESMGGPQRSPYSPPIRLLAEESTNSTMFSDLGESTHDPITALLTRVQLHDPAVPTIATFTWNVSAPLNIIPGQAVILDFTPLLGAKRYQHLAPSNPTSVNDDRIRTWTVSSSSSSSSSTGYSPSTAVNSNPITTSTSFSITMRQRPGGLVTSALFNILHKLRENNKAELLDDSRPLGLSVNVLGVTGEFSLPLPLTPAVSSAHTCKLLWIAGGIGITPFLAMLRSLHANTKTTEPRYDIRLVLSTREPGLTIRLIWDALEGNLSPGGTCTAAANGREATKLNLSIDMYSPLDGTEGPKHLLKNGTNESVAIVLRRHIGRITKEAFTIPSRANGTSTGSVSTGDPRPNVEVAEREVYICGPEAFEKDVMGFLEEVGVERGKVRREMFTY